MVLKEKGNSMEKLDKIGSYIKEKRLQHGLTQQQLAQILHLSYQAISRYELGLSLPSVETLEQMAHLFNITMEELLSAKDQSVYTYKKAGLDVDLIDLINSDLKREEVCLKENRSFRAGIYQNLAVKVQEPTSKQSIAFQYGYEKELFQDIVAALINDLIIIGAKPLYLTSTLLLDQLDRHYLVYLIETLHQCCNYYDLPLLTGQSSIKLQNSLEKTLLSMECTASIDSIDLLSCKNIEEGDCILAIGSNGIGHFGFSMINQFIEEDPSIIKTRIGSLSFLDEIMKPSFCYKGVADELTDKQLILSLVNVSGCGIYRNLERFLPEQFDLELYLEKVMVPSVFKMLKKRYTIDPYEMENTFNCGIGMYVFCKEKNKDQVMKIIQKNYRVVEVGKVVRGSKKINVVKSLCWEEKEWMSY